MTEPMPPILMKALDGLFLRQLVTAQNIANTGSDRYMPMRVSFEAALRDAALQASGAVSSVVPQILADPNSISNGEMRLDLQLQTASATTMRYNALLTVTDSIGRLKSIAMSGGA
jgi:flagellar basal-body rod protein FlgB